MITCGRKARQQTVHMQTITSSLHSWIRRQLTAPLPAAILKSPGVEVERAAAVETASLSSGGLPASTPTAVVTRHASPYVEPKSSENRRLICSHLRPCGHFYLRPVKALSNHSAAFGLTNPRRLPDSRLSLSNTGYVQSANTPFLSRTRNNLGVARCRTLPSNKLCEIMCGNSWKSP